MNAKGLMVGNYLKNDGVVVKIDARSIFDMFNDNKKYEPIELTDTWLERLGFLKRDNNLRRENPSDTFDYVLEKDGWQISIEFTDETIEDGGQPFVCWYSVQHVGNLPLCYPVYVHDIQNIWYMLCFEELVLLQP